MDERERLRAELAGLVLAGMLASAPVDQDRQQVDKHAWAKTAVAFADALLDALELRR